MECKPWEMDEGMSLIMMRMRRSLRTVLREAVLEEGLTPNEIEVLLFIQSVQRGDPRGICRLFLHSWENGGKPGGYAPGGRAAAGKRI